MNTSEWRSKMRGMVILIAGALLGGLSVWAGLGAATVAAATQARLEVLDPRAEFSTPPPVPITVRLSSLAGKKVGILNNTKEGARVFQPYLEKLLKEAEPTLELKSWTVPYNDYAGKEKDLEQIAKWSDAVIGLIGD
jgi:hypothetical protein